MVRESETWSTQRPNVENLSATSPEVMAKQATINIGIIGHVSHGKSTVVRALSGVETGKYKAELERNITIKLGYANAKIFRCRSCPERPGCFFSFGSDKQDRAPCPREGCGGSLELLRHVSFVDCPGHDALMATMLNGAAVMDAAVLLVAANESCPQPQTAEHLMAIELMQLRDLIILQNKVDLASAADAHDNYAEIRQFTKGTVARSAPVVPVAAQFGHNMDVVCEYLATKVPVPKRDFAAPARMTVVRSFDVNRPGSGINQIKGGIVGGAITQGVLKLGDEVELRPGLLVRDQQGVVKRCAPVRSTVLSLFAEKNSLEYAVPGGLIGVGTQIDPRLCRKDRLVGQIFGHEGTLPEVYSELDMSISLVRETVSAENGRTKRVNKLKEGELLKLNVGAATVRGVVSEVAGKHGNSAKAVLFEDRPRNLRQTAVCASVEDKVALSRQIDDAWRLIGWAKIKGGVLVPATPS